MYYEEYLEHYGVLGMKWGRHKAKRQAYKQKLQNIRNRDFNKDGDEYGMSIVEKKTLKYATSSVGKKTVIAIGRGVVRTVINDVLFGKTNYTSMNKKDIAKRVAHIGANTAIYAAKRHADAKIFSNKYEQSGKKKAGKDKLITKEDALVLGIDIAYKTAPIAISMGKTSLNMAYRERKTNEARFNSWGGNILSEKAGRSTIWTDGNMSILDRS